MKKVILIIGFLGKLRHVFFPVIGHEPDIIVSIPVLQSFISPALVRLFAGASA